MLGYMTAINENKEIMSLGPCEPETEGKVCELSLQDVNLKEVSVKLTMEELDELIEMCQGIKSQL